LAYRSMDVFTTLQEYRQRAAHAAVELNDIQEERARVQEEGRAAATAAATAKEAATQSHSLHASLTVDLLAERTALATLHCHIQTARDRASEAHRRLDAARADEAAAVSRHQATLCRTLPLVEPPADHAECHGRQREEEEEAAVDEQFAPEVAKAMAARSAARAAVAARAAAQRRAAARCRALKAEVAFLQGVRSTLAHRLAERQHAASQVSSQSEGVSDAELVQAAAVVPPDPQAVQSFALPPASHAFVSLVTLPPARRVR